ncbi:hypothetical protein L1887_40672 [Cichorium endivia]|nr:hypothetical protein L1887_40672 [Cichorium endivia]
MFRYTFASLPSKAKSNLAVPFQQLSVLYNRLSLSSIGKSDDVDATEPPKSQQSETSAIPQRGGKVNPTLGGIELNNSGSVVVRNDKKLLTVLFPGGRDGLAFTLKPTSFGSGFGSDLFGLPTLIPRILDLLHYHRLTHRSTFIQQERQLKSRKKDNFSLTHRGTDYSPPSSFLRPLHPPSTPHLQSSPHSVDSVCYSLIIHYRVLEIGLCQQAGFSFRTRLSLHA